MMNYGRRFPTAHYGGFMMIPAILFTIILAISLVYILVILFKKVKKNGFKFKSESSAVSDASTNALAILNERFAKGEITEEEYKSKKELILK